MMATDIKFDAAYEAHYRETKKRESEWFELFLTGFFHHSDGDSSHWVGLGESAVLGRLHACNVREARR